MNEQSIFIAALEREGDARQVFLNEACAGDLAMRERVEKLLGSHEQAVGFLDQPAGRLAPTSNQTPLERPGTQIGPYKLRQQIGEGGFGVVFMAEQEKPVRRMVALKIIKPGMDTAQVIARFESERQALAIMDHPNIAKVLEAGATDSGRPYFVMELVKGVPITEFCDKNHLPTEARLKLFIDVCHAIQHAHQKGVIHRDIKPSNVMVTLHDSVPVVKVIDFGVAKATVQKLTEKSLFTAYGQMIGTPAYMSPEQAEMSGLDIDTRSDIYSLGVLLYELLTGTTPLESKRLREAGYAEMQRLIREEEAPRPSTRLSSLGNSATVLAGNRGLDVKRLAQLLAGDLDWLVMKALDKDRNRRYGTPGSFAEDIERYLRREAILARAPSTAYKVKKFIQRNRAAVLTAAVVVVALLGGTAVSTWQAVRAVRAESAAVAARDAEAVERQSAVDQRDRAMKAEGQAQAEEQKAKQSATEARVVLKFFQDNVLAAARPEGQEGGLGRDATIRAVLEAAEPEVGGAFADQPVVEAAVRNTLGDTYFYLGEPALAIRQFERARALRRQSLGPDHPDTLQSMNDIAMAYHEAGRLPEAIALHEETLELRRAKLGPDHSDTLLSMNNLALSYAEARRWPAALALHEKTLELQQKKLGFGHSDTFPSMNNLAIAYGAAGRATEELALHEQTLKLVLAKYGPDHPNTLTSRHNVAWAYRDAGRVAEALALSEENLKIATAKLGPDHPNTLHAREGLAGTYRDARRVAEALALFEENLKLSRAKLGPDHPFTLSTMQGLAEIYHHQGDYARAEALWLEVLPLSKKTLGADHPDVAGRLSSLGLTYLKQKKFTEAEPILRECVAIRAKKLPDDWRYFNAQSQLGGSLLGQKWYADAEPLLLAGYEGLKQREAKIEVSYKVRLTESVERLVQLYETTGKQDDAAKWRKESEAQKVVDTKTQP